MSEDFRVLIVDDDFHVAKLHAAYVDSVAGFLALAPVGSTAQALQSVHSLRPDLVLLDVYLPDGSGLDLLGQLDVDAMMLTAASDAVSIRTALRRGALAYLLKPFTAESLSQQLRSYARYRRILGRQHAVDQDTIERAKRALVAGTWRRRESRDRRPKHRYWNPWRRGTILGHGSSGTGGRLTRHGATVPVLAGRRWRRRNPTALRQHRPPGTPLRRPRATLPQLTRPPK
ncbi:probable C4-dicarboxylate response regulator DctR [Arthrobacter sp. Hiyo8]|nr:probable C4-dicarboxylate response regulator DctR [Arthrobacter sp. Hiyo8]